MWVATNSSLLSLHGTSMSIWYPTVVWVTVQPAKRKRSKIERNRKGNRRNGKMKQRGAALTLHHTTPS